MSFGDPPSGAPSVPSRASPLRALASARSHSLAGLGLTVAVLPYFVLRGWTNALVVVLFVVFAVEFLRGRTRLTAADFTPAVLWLLAALVAPIVAVAAVQALRHELVLRYFDGPLRLLMSGLILLYLLQARANALRWAEVVFPIAVLLCAGLVFLWPDAHSHYWGARMASYFMDPLTLAQHVTIAGFICLFCVDATGRDEPWLRLLKYAAFIAGIAVSLGTGSRTGWTMVPVLAAVWLIGIKGYNSRWRIVLVLVAITATCAAAYWASDMIHERVNLAVRDSLAYFNGGNTDTSIGIRFSLFRINWLLFLQSPLIGWGFRGTPALTVMPEIAALATPMVEQYFVHSGGHNELMQSMMRMGVIGLVSRLLLLLVPLVVFAMAARSEVPRRRRAGYLGLVVVIGYGAASLSSEVFNLIYAASFYGLLVAAFAATALAQEAAP